MAPEVLPANAAATERVTAEGARLSRKLEDLFVRIQQERMQDVPILNPDLHVAALGMRRHGGNWLCALVTPWFINIMLLPGRAEDGEAWSRMALGTKVEQAFPAGVFEFICGADDELGPYRMCSLFSPVLQFANQEAALAAAEAALAALFDENLDQPSDPEAQPASKKEAAQVSRRTLFLGRKAARP